VPDLLPFRLLTAGLALALVWVAVPARAADGAPPQPSPSAASRAEQALAQARSLFSGAASTHERRTSGSSGTGADATLVLRDLALRIADLPTPAQRQSANRLLARPTTSDDPTGGYEPKYRSPAGRVCGAHICVHWVEDGTVDSVQGSGADGNDGDLSTVPTQVRTTLSTVEHVYAAEVEGRGFRAPLSDGAKGGNTDTDVYLADLGGDGLYGYCTSDQPDRGSARAVFGYCLLDNDYAPGQFGTRNTPLENLQVTAAHEFFHAVQFAYDWREDVWFMEGTAAWMEDEVYDGVNDNQQYLQQSPLSDPYVPMDYSNSGYLPYGSWVFWKFLSEWTGPGSADNPSIVRQVWWTARGTTYSTAALQSILLARGTSFAVAFSAFGTWSRNPSRYFSEGSAYPAATLSNAFTLYDGSRTTGRREPAPDHMTHRFYRITPGSTLTGRWRLNVAVNMAATSRGSVARLVVHGRGGGLRPLGIPLDRAGNGSRDFDFRRTVVSYLELELVNTSIRFDCWEGTSQSCQGVGLDDNLTAAFNATAVRY
jgi:hypothetical protein